MSSAQPRRVGFVSWRQRVLVLGGTTEARELARRLATEGQVEVTSSLAGRVRDPVLPEGEVRVGGFGGEAGLARWLVERSIHRVIDATHPFAATITSHAARAATQVHVPLLVLRRPAWVAGPGDRWHEVGSLQQAACILPGLGRRPLLTTGRQGVDAFADLDELAFVVRTVDPPDVPLPRRHTLLLDRGPYTLAGELDLMVRHAIDVLVTKNSGGHATAAKLEAARRRGIPVVMVSRPPLPGGVPVVHGVEDALAWLGDSHQ
ncbi:MAG: cobalt-precorrin-6A reductase [Oryzihumus sp.]